MMAQGVAAGDWIDRLAQALPALAEVQEPYLRDYREKACTRDRGERGQTAAFPAGRPADAL